MRADLPEIERVGVQLVTPAGKPLGWLATPQLRRYLRLRWNGRLNGARVPDGPYRIRLVAAGRELASSPLRIDRTAPKIVNFAAHNRGSSPFQGDNELLTTISPNGDGLRESAKIRFTLNERARVHFEVTRTISAPETIYELTANLRPGRHTFTWHPHWSVGARTYLLRVTAVDGAGNAADVRRRQRARPAAASPRRSCGCSASTPASRRRATSRSSSARLPIETDATGADAPGLPGRAGGRRARSATR